MNLFKSAFTPSEAAPYSVVQTFDKGVEERVYIAQKWITTEMVCDAHTMDHHQSDRFWTLYGFINGKNDKNQKIAMTVPVSTKVESANNQTSYQMGFYIPNEFQENPPQPTDPAVKILERELRVYAITFGGYAKEADFEKKLEELLNVLKSLDLDVPLYNAEQLPIYFFAGYDSPAKLINRRNEVWVKAV